jgi:hypothetical protein
VLVGDNIELLVVEPEEPAAWLGLAGVEVLVVVVYWSHTEKYI